MKILIVGFLDISKSAWDQAEFKYPALFPRLPSLYMSANRKSVNTSHSGEAPSKIPVAKNGHPF